MKDKRVAALGFFDGVHRGHQALLRRTVSLAKAYGAKSCAVTFDALPYAVLTGREVPLIVPLLSDRVRLLKEAGGVEEVIVLPFDQKMADMPYEGFFRLLLEKYSVAHVVIGENYTCGHGGKGTAGKISDFCARVGMGCDIVPAVKDAGGEMISSTRIRALIREEDSKGAELLLGRPYHG